MLTQAQVRIAIRKTGHARLLADMTRAAWRCQEALQRYGCGTLGRAYLTGALHATSSASERACIDTAFGH